MTMQAMHALLAEEDEPSATGVVARVQLHVSTAFFASQASTLMDVRYPTKRPLVDMPVMSTRERRRVPNAQCVRKAGLLHVARTRTIGFACCGSGCSTVACLVTASIGLVGLVFVVCAAG